MIVAPFVFSGSSALLLLLGSRDRSQAIGNNLPRTVEPGNWRLLGRVKAGSPSRRWCSPAHPKSPFRG
jgi:hypothetical protein